MNSIDDPFLILNKLDLSNAFMEMKFQMEREKKLSRTIKASKTFISHPIFPPAFCLKVLRGDFDSLSKLTSLNIHGFASRKTANEK